MRGLIRSTVPLLLLAGFFAILSTSAQAQDDPPGRVGRLNYTQGSVSYQLQGDTDWVAADPNRPLTTGDNLWVDKDSRGEVHIESTAIRLAGETGLSFLNLDDRTVQLQLPQGSIEVHLRQLEPGDAFEIDTPNLAFTLARAGEYTIYTDPNGSSTLIVVREGEGQVTGGGDSWNLSSGQQYIFSGTDQLSYDAQSVPGFNDFEAWCQTRDQRENNSASARYVSRDVDGYYDLDDYGDWSENSDYGQVWYPRNVDVDWVPYHVGHWVYIAPWGWTWVDEEPWGFAPFHYGRWVVVGSRWGWVPGPVVVRPVYAPALVGFVGGSGFGLSVSIGGGFTGVAWFPLGPRDVFVPGYRCSERYVRVVNVTNTRVVNVTQVTNVYNTVVVNRNVSHVSYTYAGNARAVTAVSRETFVNARPVGREAVRINETQMRDVHVVSATAIAPTRSSYIASSARVSTARPAVPFSQRPVVANLTPRVSMQNRRQSPPQNSNNGNGFRNFSGSGNTNNGNGHVQPPPTNNAMPANNGARTYEQSGQPNNVNASHTPARPLEQQGQPGGNNAQRGGTPTESTQPHNPPTNNVAPANNQPANQPGGNTGFRPFAPSNAGNRMGSPNNGGNAAPNGTQPTPRETVAPQNGNGKGNNNAPPQTQQNNNNENRYRFSPPVKARDDNYDVHPPLNQGKQQSQPQQQQAQQPKQQEQHDSAPRDNRQQRDSRDNKDKNH